MLKHLTTSPCQIVGAGDQRARIPRGPSPGSTGACRGAAWRRKQTLVEGRTSSASLKALELLLLVSLDPLDPLAL
jgi:hypothetical protein